MGKGGDKNRAQVNKKKRGRVKAKAKITKTINSHSSQTWYKDTRQKTRHEQSKKQGHSRGTCYSSVTFTLMFYKIKKN